MSACGSCGNSVANSYRVNGKNYCSPGCVGTACEQTIVTDRTHDSICLNWASLLSPNNANYAYHKVMVNGVEQYRGMVSHTELRNLAHSTTFSVSIMAQRWEMRPQGRVHPGTVTTQQRCGFCNNPLNGAHQCSGGHHIWLMVRSGKGPVAHSQWSCCSQAPNAAGCQPGPNARHDLPEEPLAVLRITTLPSPVAVRPLVVTEAERDRLIREISQFVPNFRADLFLRDVNILEVGPAGAGKTSTWQALATGISKSENPRDVGEIREGSAHVTRCYTRHTFREYGMPIPVELRDSVGHDSTNYLNDERPLMLDGKLPFGWPFSEPASANDPRMWHGAKFCDAIHVLLVVVPATQVRNTQQAQAFLQPYQQWLEAARTRCIPTIIVLTKMDLLDVSITNDPSRIVTSREVHNVCRVVSEVSGLQASCVFPIKNYHAEPQSVLSIDIRALMLMQRVLNAANDYYARVRNALVGGSETIRWAPVGPSIHDRNRQNPPAQQQQQQPQQQHTQFNHHTPQFQQQYSYPGTQQQHYINVDTGAGVLQQAGDRMRRVLGSQQDLLLRATMSLPDDVLLRLHTRSMNNDPFFTQLLQMWLAETSGR